MNEHQYLAWQRRLQKLGTRLFLISCGIYSELLLFGIGLYLFLLAEPGLIILAVVAAVVARGVVCEVIYTFYKKQRPYQRYGFKPPSSWFFSPLWKRADSFPSGHMAAISAAAVSLILVHPMLGILVLALAVIIGTARVFMGYHFIVDIAAGLLLGFATGFLVYILGSHWLPIY